jgi:hypothetical protein
MTDGLLDYLRSARAVLAPEILLTPVAREQIAFVVVAGKPVLAGGQPTEWDARAFVRAHRELGRRIGSAPGIQRVHGSSKGYRPKRSVVSHAPSGKKPS